MKEKQKLTDNPDIIIAGRHIEFVTGYSMAECRRRLQKLEKKGFWAWVFGQTFTVKTLTIEVHKSVSFEIPRYNKLKGTLTQQENRNTIVHATIPSTPMSAHVINFGIVIISGIALIIAYGIPLPILPLFLALFFLATSQDKKRVIKISHKFLEQHLYTPPKNSE